MPNMQLFHEMQEHATIMSGGENFGFRTIFLYNKDVQTTSVWDDFSIVVGPGYPIPFNANARHPPPAVW